MDISDKLINVCIIFAILAILSIIVGCFYFSDKTENFKDSTKENNIIEKTIKLLGNNNTSDQTIIDLMKKNKAFFKNEKFINKIVEKLKKTEHLSDKKPDKSSMKSEKPDMKSDKSNMKPEKPNMKSEKPSMKSSDEELEETEEPEEL